MSPVSIAELILASGTIAGGLAVVVKFVFRAELDRFWIRMQGEDGFVSKEVYTHDQAESDRRLAALEARR